MLHLDRNQGSQLCVFLLYCIFGIGYHAVNKKTYRTHHWALPAHALAGIAELILFCCVGEMSEVGLLLCVIQSVTNIALTKHLQKGIPALTRE